MISVREGFDIIPWMKRTGERSYDKKMTKDSKGYIEYHSNEPHIQRGSMGINPHAKWFRICIMIRPIKYLSIFVKKIFQADSDLFERVLKQNLKKNWDFGLIHTV